MRPATFLLLATALGISGVGIFKLVQELRTKDAQGPLYKPNYAVPVLMIGGGLALSIPALEAFK